MPSRELSRLNSASSPLSPAEFKAVLRKRGYSLKALAQLWGVSAARVSQIAGDPRRAPHFDFALWGVPPIGQLSMVAIRRATAARVADHKKKGTSRTHRAANGRPAFDMNKYWEENTSIGATFVVTNEQGDHIPEGCVGVVVARELHRDKQLVEICFATGYSEKFPVSFIRDPNSFLWPQGKIGRHVDT